METKNKFYNVIEKLQIEISSDTGDKFIKNDFYEFICTAGVSCTVSGSTELNECEDVKVLNGKNAILLRPHHAYVLRSLTSTGEKLKYLRIPVPADFMEREFSECSELKNFAKEEQVFKLCSGECTQIFAMAERIASQPLNEKRNYLYIKLIHRMCSNMLEASSGRRSRATKWFASLISEIENMPAEEIDYDIILKKSGVTAKTLWQTFKNFYDMTPSEYIRNKKCKAAHDMISLGHLSLIAISCRLGYGSYAQFYRDFVATYNIAPGKVKKNSKT